MFLWPKVSDTQLDTFPGQTLGNEGSHQGSTKRGKQRNPQEWLKSLNSGAYFPSQSAMGSVILENFPDFSMSQFLGPVTLTSLLGNGEKLAGLGLKSTLHGI